MRFTSTTALVIATLSIAACGGDDGGNPTVIDAKRVDSGGPDSTSSACAFPASITFGDSTGFNLTRRDSTMTAGVYNVSAAYYINEEMTAALELGFYNAYAPFGTGAAPGAIDARTINIDAVQASYETCGACMVLSTVVGGANDTTWMPNGGSLTISQIDPTVGGTYTVAFNNLTLRQVDINADTLVTTDHASGCATAFVGGSLTGSIVAPAANKVFNGGLRAAPTHGKN